MQTFFERGSYAEEVYVHALRSAYVGGYRIYDPSYALNRDPWVYEKIKRDPIIWHAIQLRKQRIAGIHWQLEPASDAPIDKAAAGVLEQLLKCIKNFVSARSNLAEGFLVGSKYAFIEGERRVMPLWDGVPRPYWVPLRLKDVNRLRFIAKPIHTPTPGQIGEVLSIEWNFWSVARSQFEPLAHPEWFVKHVYEDVEETLLHGRGLIDAIYYYWWAKEIVLNEGLAGVERWAQGLLTAKIDGLREASTNLPNNEIVRQWVAALEKMRSRHVMVYDKLDDIVNVPGPGQGHELVRDFLTYLDNSITRAILFAVLPSGGGGEGAGSFARAKEEADTTESALQFDRELLSDSLTDDLVRLVWNINRPALEALGLFGAQMPKFSIVHEKVTDPLREAQIVKTLLDAGIDLKESEVFEKVGYTPAGPEDKMIKGRPPALPPMFGPFGGQPPFNGAGPAQPPVPPEAPEEAEEPAAEEAPAA